MCSGCVGNGVREITGTGDDGEAIPVSGEAIDVPMGLDAVLAKVLEPDAGGAGSSTLAIAS